jgi:plastocyanin
MGGAARCCPWRARRRVAPALLVAATLASGTLAAGASACSRRRPQTHTVAIRSFAFQPASLTVAQGDTVVWANGDIVPHTATARDGSWDSASLASDGTWRLVAARPGRHPYYCVFHPNMEGVIEVR